MSTARPVRLRPDNFTPATRTPWGGKRILEVYKAGLDLHSDKRAYPVVGESWEISVDPAFPSVLAGAHAGTLAQLLADAPETFLSQRERAQFGDSTPLLLKLLDAAEPLSVQVHPADAYPGLGAHESGKPECWYVVHAQPGAGLYLGLAEGVDAASVAALLADGGDLTACLNFVDVAPGDCFVIRPGTVHAIGAGVTLVEPQLVLPGKTGKTYRFWDWNRRYDSDGRPCVAGDPDGAPRELHVEDSLAVTDFSAPRGRAAIDALRGVTELLAAGDGVTHERVASLARMRVERVRGTGHTRWSLPGALVAAVVVRGTVHTSCMAGEQAFRYGESFVVPAALDGLALQLEQGELVITYLEF